MVEAEQVIPLVHGKRAALLRLEVIRSSIILRTRQLCVLEAPDLPFGRGDPEEAAVLTSRLLGSVQVPCGLWRIFHPRNNDGVEAARKLSHLLIQAEGEEDLRENQKIETLRI